MGKFQYGYGNGLLLTNNDSESLRKAIIYSKSISQDVLILTDPVNALIRLEENVHDIVVIDPDLKSIEITSLLKFLWSEKSLGYLPQVFMMSDHLIDYNKSTDSFALTA